MTRLLIVPRWSGRASSDWYPWLQHQLETRYPELFTDVHIFEYPTPNAPEIAETLAALTTTFDEFRATWSDLVLVGHSVGCQALLRALAHSGMTSPARGLLCVAGWWDIDEPWPTIRPWIERVFDPKSAATVAGRVDVLLSNNDPFTQNWQKNCEEWMAQLNAEVTVVPGAKHFNGEQEPAVFEALLKLCQRQR